MYIATSLQLIPARGRLLVCKDDVLKIDSITTYPRKGTVTTLVHSYFSFLDHYNLSPQGDGNITTIHPSLYSHLYYNLSPQGDGNRITKISMLFFNIATYPRKGTQKHLRHWRLPAAEVLCFFLYSILQVGGCASRNRLCDRQCLDALRDVPLQGADLMQVDGDLLLQDLFNALGIQRQNALALQA